MFAIINSSLQFIQHNISTINYFSDISKKYAKIASVALAIFSAFAVLFFIYRHYKAKKLTPDESDVPSHITPKKLNPEIDKKKEAEAAEKKKLEEAEAALKQVKAEEAATKKKIEEAEASLKKLEAIEAAKRKKLEETEANAKKKLEEDLAANKRELEEAKKKLEADRKKLEAEAAAEEKLEEIDDAKQFLSDFNQKIAQSNLNNYKLLNTKEIRSLFEKSDTIDFMATIPFPKSNLPNIAQQKDIGTLRYVAQQQVGKIQFDIISFADVIVSFDSNRQLMINNQPTYDTFTEDDCQLLIYVCDGILHIFNKDIGQYKVCELLYVNLSENLYSRMVEK